MNYFQIFTNKMTNGINSIENNAAYDIRNQKFLT